MNLGLPPNIKKRYIRHKSEGYAPYVGTDHLGAEYIIRRRGRLWVATTRASPEIGEVAAATLHRLGEMLAQLSGSTSTSAGLDQECFTE